jgi:hypothetical protein
MQPAALHNGAHWYPLWGGMQDWHYIVTGTMVGSSCGRDGGRGRGDSTMFTTTYTM